MKILILTLYFTPDLSAGSFRMQALVEELRERHENGDAIEVDIVTSQPNRYATIIAEAPKFEDHGWLRISRISVPSHNGGMRDQARSYLKFAWEVHKLTAGKRWDLVFATSSRLMTAGLGAHVARRARAPLYLDIRDLFSDNMQEILLKSPLKAFMPLIYHIERRAFRQARTINVVSAGFFSYVTAIAPGVQVSVISNGIDRAFLSNSFEKEDSSDGVPLILYAGNMGEGQGLHKILPEAARRLQGIARFRLIGDGGRRQALEAALDAASVTNVELLAPVPRAELLKHYRRADYLFMHLNDFDSFRRVIPSKVFEYAAVGKPILAGVSGHAAEFCHINLPDALIFNPLDVDRFVECVEKLALKPVYIDRTTFRENYSRDRMTKLLADDILDAAKQRKV